MNETSKKPLASKYVFRRFFAIAVVCLLWYGCAVFPVYRTYRTTYGLSSETVASITFQPNGDWSPITLDEPEDIDAFIQWLGSTRHQGRLRSAPPPCIYPGSIELKDGTSEPFRMSAAMDAWTPGYRAEFLHGLSESRDYDTFYEVIEAQDFHNPPISEPRGDIVIWIRDRRRSGSRQAFQDLFGLELPDAAAESVRPPDDARFPPS